MSQWTQVFRLTVLGVAQPRGSKTSVPLYDRITGDPVIRKDGNGRRRVICRTIDDNPKSGKWMSTVRQAAERLWGAREPIDAPIFLDCTIVRERPQGHYRADGSLRPSAPVLPDTIPDLTKLVRGIEDALGGVVMANDSRITDHRTRKRFGSPPRVEIVLYAGPKMIKDVTVQEQPKELFA